MKKRLLAILLVLVMVLALLPVPALAANADLPDWYLLFAIFKNVDADYKDPDGRTIHAQYSMTPEEVRLARKDAQAYEEYMNQVGVMRAHVDVVEIDETVTELDETEENGSHLSARCAAPLLEGKVDLDKYDHITCAANLHVNTSYWGLSAAGYENGAGHASVNLVYCQSGSGNSFPESVYVHEFLHFMEQMDEKWGAKFDLHDIRLNFYEPKDEENCYTDIILNRAKGSSGTGVHPVVWQYPPHVLRTMTDFAIPAGVTGIGDYAFLDSTGLTSVSIPAGVTGIGYAAFSGCTGLVSVSMPAGVAGIGDFAFNGCTSLTSVSISPGVTEIGYAVFNGCTSLASVSLPAGVTGIGDHAFRGCAALREVFLPASLTKVGYAAFYDTDIRDVYYSGTKEQWAAISFGEFNDPLTSAAIHYGSAAPEGSTAPANPTNDRLTVNGAEANPAAYKINEANYFKLRDLAALLSGTGSQFNVDWDGATQSAAITTGQAYERLPSDLQGRPAAGATASLSDDVVYLNGTQAELTIYKVNDNNYIKLRDLGILLDFFVGYENGTIVIDTTRPYSE